MYFLRLRLPLVALVMVVAFAATADAGVYPGNKCVSSKMKEAGKLCKGALKAWSGWDKSQDATKRDEKLLKISTKFAEKWNKADTKASSKGVNCADTTIDVAGAQLLIDAAVASVVADINAALTLTNPDEGACGSKLLGEAAKRCAAYLKAESKFIKKLDKDPQAVKRDEAQAKAGGKFAEKFDKILLDGCPTTASAGSVGALLDQANADVVRDTTISPNVPDDSFVEILHPEVGQPGHVVEYEGDDIGPRCQDFSQYRFWARRGTVNKLVMYYQGGGACWNNFSCLLNQCDQDIDPNGIDNPNNIFMSGLADLDDPNNPLKDWHVVFVPYCTCDLHWGDASQQYIAPVLGTKVVEHRGYDNAKLAEKYAREHFVNPDEVLVAGSSAGGFGALFHAIPVARVYAASHVSMLADAASGVASASFLANDLPLWGIEEHLDDLDVPGISDQTPADLNIVQFMTSAARAFPDVDWAQYSTGFDMVQSLFYNAQVNDTDTDFGLVASVWPEWWRESCNFNAIQAQQFADIEAITSSENDNYRSYVGTGTRHIIYFFDKVYTDTTGGVPTVADWVDDLLTDDPAWVSEAATPDTLVLLPDDAVPAPLVCPFEVSGPDTVINCASCVP